MNAATPPGLWGRSGLCAGVRALKVSLSFWTLMGVLWIPSIFTHVDSTAAQYLFAVTASFSGLWLFVFHCWMDQRLRDAVRPFLCSGGKNRLCVLDRRYAGTA